MPKWNHRVEILVEEKSMELFLRTKLPEMLPPGFVVDTNVFIRPHNGKSDLRKSIPLKVKAFSNDHLSTYIVIIHDQDSNDCKQLKQEIQQLCASAGSCPVLVRIACRELENWYLGDMQAIEHAYPSFKASKHTGKSKFRNPDHCHGADEMSNLIKNFQKGQAARDIPPHMDLARNRSTSLQHVVSGIRRFLSTS